MEAGARQGRAGPPEADAWGQVFAQVLALVPLAHRPKAGRLLPHPSPGACLMLPGAYRVQLPPAVDDGAEEPGGLLGRRWPSGPRCSPTRARRLGGPGQDRLAEHEPPQGHGVEDAEGMEGVALEPGALHRRLQEAQVEGALWPTSTARLQPVDFTALRMGTRMRLRASCSGTASRKGWSGSIPLKARARGRSRPRGRAAHGRPGWAAGSRCHRLVMRMMHRRDLQQGVALGVEARRLHVHHHR
jgi:hypothetical protein